MKSLLSRLVYLGGFPKRKGKKEKEKKKEGERKCGA